jgi:EAL domain-containing protein (putative c-di-GMP-specific phosphodiesterase class I)
MARSLNLATIAEGVTSTAQVDLLQASGCQFVQGFLYGRPMPTETLEKWIRQRDSESGPRTRRQGAGLPAAISA